MTSNGFFLYIFLPSRIRKSGKNSVSDVLIKSKERGISITVESVLFRLSRDGLRSVLRTVKF